MEHLRKSMSAFLIIIAHGNALETFRRHRSLWKDHPHEGGVVIVPENDSIDQNESQWPVVRIGKAEHNGTESLKRLRWLLNLHETQNQEHFVIYEYDSFCLFPDFRYQLGLCGNLYANQKPERFLAPRYANPPWIIDNRSLALMDATSKRWPDIVEEGEADRYLSAVAYLSNVPVLNHAPPGFSEAHIEENQIPSMRSAIHSGATMIHGVKQRWVYEAALQFFDQRTLLATKAI